MRRIIDAKFGDFIIEFDRFEYLIRRDGILVPLGGFEVIVSRDPNDDMVIETAIAGRCQYIVSGDKDLLSIGHFENIKILKSAQLQTVLKDFEGE